MHEKRPTSDVELFDEATTRTLEAFYEPANDKTRTFIIDFKSLDSRATS